MTAFFKNLWAVVSGADAGKTYPQQQISALNRAGDAAVLYPYGQYCNLPDGALVQVISPGIALPVTVDRPDTARGEVAFFHPVTGSSIIFRDDGTIEVNGDLIINGLSFGAHGHEQGNDSDGNTQAKTDGPS